MTKRELPPDLLVTMKLFAEAQLERIEEMSPAELDAALRAEGLDPKESFGIEERLSKLPPEPGEGALRASSHAARSLLESDTMGRVGAGLPFSLLLLTTCGGSTSPNGTSGSTAAPGFGAQYCGADTVWCGGQCVAVQVASQVCPSGSSSSAAVGGSAGSSEGNSGIGEGGSGSTHGAGSASSGPGSASSSSGSASSGGDAGPTSPPWGTADAGSVDASAHDAGSWVESILEVSDAGTANLPYDVVAAAYSRAVDSIVIVSSVGNELHLVDPHTLDDVALALPLPPASVAISPDGTHAAVGHDGFISYVDLIARTVENTWNVPAPFGSVALSNTYVYGIPSSDQWVSLYAVATASGTVTANNMNFTWAGSQMVTSPDGQSLYYVEVGLEPESIYSFNLANPAAPVTKANYFGDQEPPCGIMWISRDGTRLYTGCGYVFNTNGLTYFGALPNANRFVAGVDDWSSDGTVAVLAPSSAQSSTGADQLQLYGPQFLTLNGTISLPSVDTPEGMAPSDGRYVFHDAAGTSIFAIVHASDPSSQVGVFAVAHLQ